MLCAALAFTGCGKSSHAGTNDGESATTSTAPADKSAQQLYESKRYAEAKALALRDAEQATGHDREVALLTAGLSAHAQVCNLPDDHTLNHRSLMRREVDKKRWTDQQTLYINQLHLTTVMLLTVWIWRWFKGR